LAEISFFLAEQSLFVSPIAVISSEGVITDQGEESYPYQGFLPGRMCTSGGWGRGKEVMSAIPDITGG
jgi:hypothetical protein